MSTKRPRLLYATAKPSLDRRELARIDLGLKEVSGSGLDQVELVLVVPSGSGPDQVELVLVGLVLVGLVLVGLVLVGLFDLYL